MPNILKFWNDIVIMEIVDQIEPAEIRELLHNPNERLVIPSYQRRYSWGEDQFEDLWKDLNKIEHEKEDHFIGTIVFKSNEGSVAQGAVKELDIVDGQQRITTISILICAIRDYLEERNAEKSETESIEKKLYRLNTYEKKEEIKLKLGNLDRESYESLVKGNIQNVDNENILEGYNYFKQKLENSFEEREKIKNLYEKIINQLIYVSITAKGHSDAYELFESMNNRGLSLSPVDLMKNYLLMKCSKNDETSEDRIENLWGEVIKNIDNIGDLRNPGNTFFRQYFMSSKKYGFDNKITKNKLYEPIFTQTVDESDSLEDFLKDLKEKSNLYNNLMEANIDNFNVSVNSEINRLLKDARVISRTSFTLLLRSFIEMDDSESLKKVIRMSNTLLLRRQVCDRTTSPHDDIFSHLSQNMFDSEDPIAYMKSYLKEDDRLPSDEQFKEYFANEDFKNNPTTKYILSQIEENHFGKGGKKVVESRYQVHIEHILPVRMGKNLRKMWLEPYNISDKDHNEFKKKIGNLTLLEEDPNISASNRSFEKKKDYYAPEKTDFKMTHELENHSKWKPHKIKQRSEKLADIACDIWKID